MSPSRAFRPALEEFALLSDLFYFRLFFFDFYRHLKNIPEIWLHLFEQFVCMLFVLYPLSDNCVNRNHEVITCPPFREASSSPLRNAVTWNPAVSLGLPLLFLFAEGQKNNENMKFETYLVTSLHLGSPSPASQSLSWMQLELL